MTVSIVQSFSGVAHLPTCYTIKGKKPYRQFAGIEESEIHEFLEAKKLTACNSCLPKPKVAA